MHYVDKEYWRTQLTPPYSPNQHDVEIYYQNKIAGTTLLLGCTHLLLKLSDKQMDHDPWFASPTVIKLDWRLNTENYTNIIGDGVLNFTEELANGVLKMAQNRCQRLIVRSFNFKLPTMKIANYFADENTLSIKPSKTIKFAEYSFFIWDFQNED